jgi:hypothetical protein
MAITVSGRYRVRKVAAGQDGYTEVYGIAAYSTTDANGTIKVPFKTIDTIEIQDLGADESYPDEGAHVVGNKIVVASGQVTIARGTQNVSGQKFIFRITGNAA